MSVFLENCDCLSCFGFSQRSGRQAPPTFKVGDIVKLRFIDHNDPTIVYDESAEFQQGQIAMVQKIVVKKNGTTCYDLLVENQNVSCGWSGWALILL